MSEATSPGWRAWAPGKVILLGEHAVVYGRTALAGAIERGVTVTVERIATGLVVEVAGVLPGGDSDRDRLRVAVEQAARAWEVEPEGLRVRVAADLPIAVGLGSSAALSVALVQAFAALAGRAPSRPQVCEAAFGIERFFHGFPSGIDNTVATYGGLLAFRRGEPHRCLPTAAAVPLVVALGREPRQTRSAVERLRAAWEKDRGGFEARFDRIADLVKTAEEALAAGNWQELGLLFDENHRVLAELGVSTPELDAMVALAREAGARGAKLTGGGGGGAVICLCPEDRTRLVARLRAAGWQAFATELRPVMDERHVERSGGLGSLDPAPLAVVGDPVG